jgi:1-acyl-sn-glycerol-3-phosphate acyltransferase
MRATLRFRAARRALRLLLGGVFRVRVEGRERLPADGPYVLACNHLSWIDPFLLIGWLPATPRLHFLGKRSAVHNRAFKRWVLALVGGVIPVEGGQVEQVAAAVDGVLRRGGAVAIFPEGGVGPAEGTLQPLRHGVAHFGRRSRVPVVAAGLAGTSDLWRGKELRVRIGRAIGPDEGEPVEATVRAIESALLEAMPPCPPAPSGPRPWPWLTHLLR